MYVEAGHCLLATINQVSLFQSRLDIFEVGRSALKKARLQIRPNIYTVSI